MMTFSTEQLLQIIGSKQLQIDTLSAQLQIVSKAYAELKQRNEPEQAPAPEAPATEDEG